MAPKTGQLESAHKIKRILFKPNDTPYQGMSTFMAGTALGPGWWSLATNVRSDNGVLYMRNGILKRTTTAINSGTGTFASAAEYPLASYSSPGVVAALAAGTIWGGATPASFTELTQASGPFGSTRMSALSGGDGLAYFAPALYPGDTTTSYLVVQNGIDVPRILRNVTGGDFASAIHNPIVLPANKSNGRSKPTYSAYWAVKDGTATTLSTPTGTSVAFADTSGASTTLNTITLTCTNPVLGDQARCVFGASMVPGTARQFVIIGTGSLANFSLFNKIKISIGDSGTFVAIYDATAVGNNEFATQTHNSEGTVWSIAFNLDAVIGAASIPSPIDRIQVEWTGATESAATYTITIYAMCCSGQVPGNSLHAYTYANQNSRAESVPQYITDTRPDKIYNVGASTALDYDVGNSSDFYYNYVIGFLHTSTTERNKGTNYLHLYRLEEGEEDYFYVSTTTIATYSSPNWSFSNHGSTSAYGKQTLTDSTFARNYFIRAPDPQHTPIPTGKAMIAANGRLYVAATHGAGAFSKLYISEHRHPFRFLETPRKVDDLTDPSSATTHLFEGEDIQGFAAVSVGYGGASYIYVFTDQNIYMIGADVNRVQKIASVGTLSPQSIAEFRGTVFFLDADRKVRILEAGVLRDISDRMVEDILLAIPAASWAASRLHKVTGAIWNGCYRLGYSPSGETTNTNYLMFDVDEQKWYQNDPAGTITVEQLLPYKDTSKKILLGFSSSLHVYEIEKSGQTTDDGTNPTMTLTTCEFQLADWMEFTIGRVGVICDDVSSGSIAVTRSYRPGSGSNATSTINVDVTPSQAWRYDGAITQGNDLRGTWGKLSLSFQAPAATNIYELMCYLHPRGRGASVPAS